MKIKRMVIISMLLAMAIVLNIVESYIPMMIPGVRLGLSNVIILIMLYDFKWQEALSVLLLKILLVGILRGNLMQFQWYMSLSGGILSFLIMFVFSKFKFFSPIGVSILGSIFHATGQIMVAVIVMDANAFIYYLPIIALLSTLTGIFTGIITKIYLKRGLTKKFLID